MLLQVNPEEHGITYEVLDRDSHGLQFRKRKMFRGFLRFPSIQSSDTPVSVFTQL
jgi:hypothetical protein